MVFKIIEIKKRLKKLKLTNFSVNTLQEAVLRKRKSYRTVCQNFEGKKVFFKCILQKERIIRNRFLNEINFLKAVNKNPDYPLYKFVPKILDYSTSRSFPYLIYKFIEGETRLSEDKFSVPEIKQIAHILHLIHSSPTEIFEFIPSTPLFGYSFLQKKFKFFLKNPLIEKSLKQKILTFVSRQKKILYNKKKTVRLTHGDFSESNLIFSKGTIKVIDWEHTHLRNPLYDVADFWIKRRKHKIEQNTLISEYFKNIKEKEKFQILFKSAILEICLRDLSLFQKTLENLKKKKIARKIRKKEKEVKEYLEILKNTL